MYDLSQILLGLPELTRPKGNKEICSQRNKIIENGTKSTEKGQ
jgi:hypothetical protein